uniref:Uncharacterized protein n=1 Tax=Ditylenchus dipsaci TaxID=166011 RepID=A0A915DW54_9BILA
MSQRAFLRIQEHYAKPVVREMYEEMQTYLLSVIESPLNFDFDDNEEETNLVAARLEEVLTFEDDPDYSQELDYVEEDIEMDVIV